MTASVLIVEDEESILLSLEFLLGKEGYAVTTARDGAEALRLLEQSVPDLVLLDVMLPLIDGFELCATMRAMPALAGTRIMLVTARGREAEIARGLALGADTYLTKPFSTRELMDRVRALLASPRTSGA
jgi:two-component system, OmpR family, alkaline phosphatase synthesis response regulator PhoP